MTSVLWPSIDEVRAEDGEGIAVRAGDQRVEGVFDGVGGVQHHAGVDSSRGTGLSQALCSASPGRSPTPPIDETRRAWKIGQNPLAPVSMSPSPRTRAGKPQARRQVADGQEHGGAQADPRHALGVPDVLRVQATVDLVGRQIASRRRAQRSACRSTARRAPVRGPPRRGCAVHRSRGRWRRTTPRDHRPRSDTDGARRDAAAGGGPGSCLRTSRRRTR